MKQTFLLIAFVALPAAAQHRPPVPDPRVEVALSTTVIQSSERSVAFEKTLPPLGEDEYYSFQLAGLVVEEEGGRVLGRVREVLDYPANDVLELDSGLSLPLVESCVRKVDVESGRIVVAPGFADSE